MKKTVIKLRNTEIPVVRIETSKLLLSDAFLQYIPQTDAQQNLKERLENMIPNGLNDFYKPIYDPSFTRQGEIAFVEGKTPAIGKSYTWWEKAAQELLPEYGSRLGTEEEYIAFLGVLIKTLSNTPNIGFNPWEAICDDSRELGHYWNSKEAKEDYEKTGSRKVSEFYDLANVFKALKSKDGNLGFCIASGTFLGDGQEYPIATIKYRLRNNALNKGVGWIIFDRC